MSILEIKQQVGVKNRFIILVEDILTGGKREYKAENIVLDAMFSRLLNFQPFFVNIHFGTGTGVFDDRTRTSLYTYLGTRAAVTEFQIRELPTSHWRRRIVLNPEEYVGETITELGVAYGGSAANIVTHAAPKDSEGNLIVIGPKLDTEVVTIYADIFFELGEINSMYQGEVRWAEPLSTNLLLNYFMGGTFPTQSFRSGWGKRWGGVVEGHLGNTDTVTVAQLTKDAINKKVTTPTRRFGVSVGNGPVRRVGFGSTDAVGTMTMRFPVSTVYEQRQIIDEVVGVGDGATTAFNLLWDDVIPDTQVIKIDGVEAANLTFSPKREHFGPLKTSPTPAITGGTSTPQSAYHVFSSDYKYVAVYTNTSAVYLHHYSSENSLVGNRITIPSLPASPTGVGFSVDDRHLIFTINAAPWIVSYAFNPETGVVGDLVSEAPPITATTISIPRGLTMTSNGDFIVISWWQNSDGILSVHPFDTATGQIGAVLSNPNLPSISPYYEPRLSSSNDVVSICGASGIRFYEFDANSGAIGQQITNPAGVPTGTISDSCFSPDDCFVAIGVRGNHQLWVYPYDSATRMFGARIANPSSFNSVTNNDYYGRSLSWSPDGTRLALGLNISIDGYLHVYEFDPVVAEFGDRIPTDNPPVSGYMAGINHIRWPEGKAISMSHAASGGNNNFSIFPYEQGSKYNMIFDTPPAADAPITASYKVSYPTKSEKYVLDISFSLQFGEVV